MTEQATATTTRTDTKPHVRPLGELAWSVTLTRAPHTHRATVSRVRSVKMSWEEWTDTVTIHGADGSEYTYTLPAKPRTEAELLAHVLGYFKAVEDMQTWCDEQLAAGAFNLTKKTEKALAAGMIALAHGVGVVVVDPRWHEGVFAFMVAGLFVRYFGTERGYTKDVPPRSYLVGDECVVDSYNLEYLGTITKITADYIWCRYNREDKQKRHTVDSFRTYNRKTVADAAASNATWMD
jgi:hypothetical protein